MSKKNLVIVGMHRSGTSLVTQWLYRCGLSIGNNLEGAGIGNIRGHFEDLDFLKLHQKFLKKRNCPTTGYVSKPIPGLSDLEKQEMRTLIAIKNRQHDEWGWKDPRTSLLLEGYNELMPSAFYIIIVRSYTETVNSLIRREHLAREKEFSTKKGMSKLFWQLFKKRTLEQTFKKRSATYLKVWINYYEQILAHVQSLPANRFMFVNYAALAENDQDVFTRLKSDWHFSLDYFAFSNVYEKELLSRVSDIGKYITDRGLIKKAFAIENIALNFTVLSSTIKPGATKYN